MKDRVPTRAGRVLITPESGAAFYAVVQMADEPEEVGTPLNKANLLSDDTAELLGLLPDDDPSVDDAFRAVYSPGNPPDFDTMDTSKSRSLMAYKGALSSSDSLDNRTDVGIYQVTASEGIPDGAGNGVLVTTGNPGNRLVQLYLSGTQIWTRSKMSVSAEWTSWAELFTAANMPRITVASSAPSEPSEGDLWAY